jgi:DNA-binding transcriptional regulator GbsR (MarR family)
MNISLTDTQLRMIEELGVAHEKAGMQPAAARIFALLVVCDQNELTFEQIYELLKLSKSATSNSINYLLNIDRIEYITNPGERKRYFRVKLRSIKDAIHKSLIGLGQVNELFKKVLEQRPNTTADFNNGLKEMTEFMDFILAELPLLYQKWEASK